VTAIIAWSAVAVAAIADGAVAVATIWLCAWCLRHWHDGYAEVVQDIADMIMPMRDDDDR